ncbi:hypothetical protein [Rhizobium sp. TRM95796]|uniref:hypothetical protein n=1 Tax=Rhizobium sp. TRM95796 TaxID=2979862 RepID=UPI0021E93AB1|nr:hypothetical protein [Rhizobium sp. TRM95796]MCV3769081.1 hypothetical protein [Rhizobium sp. TRM95796]
MHACAKLLSSEHYLRSEDRVIGAFDAKRIDIVGEYLLSAGVLVDENGKVLTEKPDFSTYATNEYLPAK